MRKNKAPEPDEERFNAIVDAVCYWLGYQFKIGRDKLMHEASLRYPIADTITAKGVAIHRIILEQLHPIFKSKKIDLVIYADSIQEPQTEKDDTNLSEVFEFKLAKKETNDEYKDEHQRVFNDVVRLAYYNLWRNKSCYFLMCGEYQEFKTFFVGQKKIPKKEKNKNIIALSTIAAHNRESEKWLPNGLYKDWFKYEVGKDISIEFKESDHSDWGLILFQKDYDIRPEIKQSYSSSIKVKTTCLAITPPGLENIKTHAAGIWKIEAFK